VVEVTLRPTEIDDAIALAAQLRHADRAEADAALGDHDLLEAILASIRGSSLCWTALSGDEHLIAVFGVAPISDRVGSPWMLGTDRLDHHAKSLMRLSPPFIRLMRDAFPHLVNFVHAENRKSIRWLSRLGFTLSPPQPYGARGELFHPFEMRAHV
jgi:hypothetical protein